jgi:hypothetical protein
VWVVCGAGGCITYKTAWLLAQKLRRSMIDPKREPLEGVVELDQAKIPFRADDSLFYPVKSGKIRIAGAVEVIDRGTNQATPGRKGRNTRMLALAASGSPPLGGSGSPSIVSFNRNSYGKKRANSPSQEALSAQRRAPRCLKDWNLSELIGLP